MALAMVPGAAFADLADACSAAADVSFDDTDGGIFEAQINCIAGYGVVQGDGSGNFDPTGDVTRGQAAEFLVNTIEAATGEDLPDGGVDQFSDVDDDSTFSDPIGKLTEAGIIAGYPDGTYRPTQELTRGQMAKLVFETHESVGNDLDEAADEPFTDVADGGVFAGAIAALFDAGIVNGTTSTTFSPGNDITRAQLSAFVANSIVSLDDAGLFAPTASTVTTGTVINGAGDFDAADGTSYLYADFDADADATYTVDGDQVSAGLFAAEFSAGDTITLTDSDDDGDIDTFELTNNDPPTSGLVGAVNTTAQTFGIVTAANNLLNTIDYTAVDGDVTYSVDGDDTADAAAFEDDLSHGDTVAVTDDNDDADYDSVELTNGSPSGDVADLDTAGVDTAEFTLDGVLGDDPDNAEDALFVATLAEGTADTQEYSVDGSTVAYAAFEAALSDGDVLTYSRTEGVESFVLVTATVDASFEGTTVDPDGADPLNGGNDIQYIDGESGDVDTFDITTADVYEVDGVESTEGEFRTAVGATDGTLPVGETIALADGADEDTLSITTATDSGSLVVSAVSTDDDGDLDDDTITVQTAGGTGVGVIPAGFAAGSTDPAYFVNDDSVDAAEYEDYLADIANSGVGAEAGGDTFRAVITADDTEHRLTTNNSL